MQNPVPAPTVENLERFWMKAFNEKGPTGQAMGMRLRYNERNEAVITMGYNPDFDHAQGGIHGGVYMTLLDNAGWFTAALATGEPCWVATSEMTTHFPGPARRTGLRAEAEMIKQGRRQHIVAMSLYDDEGERVGHATGTFVILPDVDLFAKEHSEA